MENKNKKGYDCIPITFKHNPINTIDKLIEFLTKIKEEYGYDYNIEYVIDGTNIELKAVEVATFHEINTMGFVFDSNEPNTKIIRVLNDELVKRPNSGLAIKIDCKCGSTVAGSMLLRNESINSSLIDTMNNVLKRGGNVSIVDLKTNKITIECCKC